MWCFAFLYLIREIGNKKHTIYSFFFQVGRPPIQTCIFFRFFIIFNGPTVYDLHQLPVEVGTYASALPSRASPTGWYKGYCGRLSWEQLNRWHGSAPTSQWHAPGIPGLIHHVVLAQWHRAICTLPFPSRDPHHLDWSSWRNHTGHEISNSISELAHCQESVLCRVWSPGQWIKCNKKILGTLVLNTCLLFNTNDKL